MLTTTITVPVPVHLRVNIIQQIKILDRTTRTLLQLLVALMWIAELIHLTNKLILISNFIQFGRVIAQRGQHGDQRWQRHHPEGCRESQGPLRQPNVSKPGKVLYLLVFSIFCNRTFFTQFVFLSYRHGIMEKGHWDRVTVTLYIYFYVHMFISFFFSLLFICTCTWDVRFFVFFRYFFFFLENVSFGSRIHFQFEFEIIEPLNILLQIVQSQLSASQLSTQMSTSQVTVIHNLLIGFYDFASSQLAEWI